MTITTFNPAVASQHFSSTESLDSVDVTPTALFRGSSFDVDVDVEVDSGAMTESEHHCSVKNPHQRPNPQFPLNHSTSSSSSSSLSLSKHGNENDRPPQFRNNLYPHLNEQYDKRSKNTTGNTPATAANDGNHNPSHQERNKPQDVNAHSNNTTPNSNSNSNDMDFKIKSNLYDDDDDNDNSCSTTTTAATTTDEHATSHPLTNSNVISHINSNLNSQQHSSSTNRVPSLPKYSTVETAAVLFPPILPTTTPTHKHSNSVISSVITNNPLSIISTPKRNIHSTMHHIAPSTIMKEKNLNISQDTSCCTSESMTTCTTTDTNTVVTEGMVMTTDEDSFDISPVRSSTRSPVKKVVGSTLLGGGGNGGVTSGCSTSSTIGTGVVPTTSTTSSATRSATIVSSSKYSNSRKRTSSDRKKSKPRSIGTYDENGNNTGLQSRSISRVIFSPAPYSSHKKNGNIAAAGGFGSGVTSANAFRSYRVPSIEPCHSFDSHDSNTTNCSNNDFLTNMMDPGAIHNSTNHNNSTMSASTQMIHNDQQPHFHPQSTSKPTQYTTGWSSSFIFSGSPIEEEENEDSCSPFHHLNGKKPKRMDERRLVDNIGGRVNVQTDDVDGGMRVHGNGEDDHVSSKIRKLNLDCEMDCTNDETLASSITQENVFVPLRSSGTSTDRLSFSSDEEVYRNNDTAIEGQQQRQRQQQEGQQQQSGQFERPELRKSPCEDSFRLHVNTDFQSSLDNDSDDDLMKEGNLKAEENQISPNEVTDFGFPLHPLSSIRSNNSNTRVGSNPDRSTNFTTFKTMIRNTESPLPPPITEKDGDIVPPPNTFSSPPPLVKKGLHDPPSPYRLGRVQNLNIPLPPTTPMVPQKAMRRMRGNNDICSSPFLNLGIPSSGRSSGSTDVGSTPFNRKSRFYEDFEILDTLGNGSFGTVYKCRQRVDGRLYAVKAAKRRAKGRADRERMLKEVVALAELSDAAGTTAFHILRYHQAWMEEDKLHIVTELCTSTLQVEMHNGVFRSNTKRLYKLLREMLLALKLIHQHDLVHLDIKPENIFIREDTFKLGDFGLVSKVSVQDDVEEGDSRYMCMDLLSGNHEDLTKCDIFSLGITMYEIVHGSPLPGEGQEWQDLRAGRFSDALRAQPDLQNIIKSMMDPEASRRPNAAELLTRRQLLSEEEKRLIREQNKVREANRALAFQEERFRKISSPRKTLTRSNTCPRYM